MLRATQGSPLRNSRVLRCGCASVVKKSRTSYDNAQSPPGSPRSNPRNPTIKNLCALCASVVKKSPTNPNIAPFPLTSNPRPPTKTLGALGVLGGENIPYHPRQSAIPARFTTLESTLSYQKSLCPLCLCGEKRPLTPDKAPFPLTSNPRHPTIKSLCPLCLCGEKRPLPTPTSRHSH